MIHLAITIAVVTAMFASTENMPVRIACIISMGILACMMFKAGVVEDEPRNENQKQKTHKTKKISVKYICHYVQDKETKSTPIVEGSFQINPVGLDFKPQKEHYRYLVEKALINWLDQHFKFTYEAKIKGESFNGTFESTVGESGAQGEKGQGKSNDDKEPSDP